MNKQEAIAAMFASRASVLAEEAKQRNQTPPNITGGPWEACGQYVRNARTSDNPTGDLVAEVWLGQPNAAEVAKLMASAPLLLKALTEERRLRIIGQQPETHWESLRDLRRQTYAATDAAILAATGSSHDRQD